MKRFDYILTSIFVTAIISLAVICGSFFINSGDQPQVFAKGTIVDGVDVSGLDVESATEKVNTSLDKRAENSLLTLTFEGQNWTFGGGNFAVNANTNATLNKVVKRGKGNYHLGDDGLYIEYVFNGMEDKLEEVFIDIEKVPMDATIEFNPDSDKPFAITPHVVGVMVDRARLCDEILSKLKTDNIVTVEVPVIKTEPMIKAEDLEKYTKEQASFSTDFSKSSSQRKQNIRLAFSKINGTRLESGATFSFNDTVGERTVENGYQEAKIILAGEYENGIGGGICQASTTLYNAVIRAGLEVIEVKPHSMPASYVPLSLDAMVSWGYSDLKFSNNSDGPVFIKATTDDSKVMVTIYGNTLAEGQKLEPRAELVKTLYHNGDKVVADTEGLYQDKIMFKGEYVRVNYPREGYESKAYIDVYENGIKVSERQIRHDTYSAKQGLVYEGVETLPEGMTLPANNVSIIPPQVA